MAQSQTDGSTWSSALRVPRILCFALAASCAIYAGLMVFGLLTAQQSAEELMGLILPVMALGMLPMAYFVPRLVTPTSVESPTREAATGMFRDATESVLADPVDARAKFVDSEFTPYILRCALCESIAIFGLVSYMSFGTPLPISVGLCVVAAVAILANFPRAEVWEKRAEARLRARFPGADD